MDDAEELFSKFFQGYKDSPQAQLNYKIHETVDRKSPLSVYYCNYRSIYEDNYPAKFDDELARFLIKLYSKEGETVLDPMGGSGVIPLVAIDLNRHGYYQDINEPARALFVSKLGNLKGDNCWRYQSIVADSTKRIEICKDDSVDLILTSPPFGLSIDQKHDKYSDNKEDLGNSETYEIWRQRMKAILKECFRVLKPGHLAIFETRPRSKKGHSYPLDAWIKTDGVEIGFDFYCEYIEIVDTYRMWTFGPEDRRMPIPAHSYLTVLRKPEQETLD